MLKPSRTKPSHLGASSVIDSMNAAKAIAKAFDVLGPKMKKVLLYHLEEFHGFVVGRDDSLSLLQRALQKIFGDEGAKMVMEYVYLEIEKRESPLSQKSKLQ